MKSIKANELLNNLCQEYNIKLPNNLQTMKIYEEIENFKDAEYIYCIAYEMLIRTDEYNTLLKEYEPLKNKSKYDMSNDEFSKLRELINKMNALGLKKTSFLGFDCDDDNDHVFKRIEYYDEIINSRWNVRMIHKFELDPSLGFNSIFHMLIDFYNKKNELYIFDNGEYKNIFLHPQETKELSQINFINKINIIEIKKAIDIFFIPYLKDGDTKYKALKDFVYLKELDDDFLSQLKEKQSSNLLIQTKSNFSHYNIEFWAKYYVNDIKDGLNKLIEFHIKNNLVYDQDSKHTVASKNEILENPSKFYIPCVNRLIQPEILICEPTAELMLNNKFVEMVKYDGVESLVRNKGYIKYIKQEGMYLAQISNHISLSLLDDSFLETLTYEDLKNVYLNTEPIFSRPRLMFDEARLTNVPMNLNLSKEDLLLYISQIKDNYDTNKKIVQNDLEYFFDLTLECDLIGLPENIKPAYEKRDPKFDKKIFPKKRKEFKKSLALAFYIYDIYKFFIPLFEKKRISLRNARDSEIQNEKDSKGMYTIDNKINRIKSDANIDLKKYENNNLLTIILKLVNEQVSEEQVEYYLTTMKEFIHGVNKEGENHVFKKQNNPEKNENFEPKYKNVIIGDSYIIKSNKEDLIRTLKI